MNPHNQNIAIAEACGLFRIEPLRRTTRKGAVTPDGVMLWYCESHHGGASTYAPLPNYYADLNACHEMIAGLSEDGRHRYAVTLAGMLWVPQQMRGWQDFRDTLAVSESTAPQRCEAFLKTLGKWEVGRE